MAIRAVYERLSAFNDRPGAETVFTDADIVNRTLLNALEEALVHNGVFPVDKALAVDRMASLRDRRTGVVNATDEVRNEFNPATNRVEDVNRDPVAKSAVDTAEYLGKLRLMFFSIAFLLHGVKCDKEPLIIIGKEDRYYCSLRHVIAFLKQVDELKDLPVAQVRAWVGLTLNELAENVNRFPRTRLATCLDKATEGLKRDMKPIRVGNQVSFPPAPPDAGSSSAPVDPAGSAASAAGGKGGGPGGKGKGKGKRASETPEQKQARKDAASKRRTAEYTDAAGKTWKARLGGNDDADPCQNWNCQKGSWCARSHKAF